MAELEPDWALWRSFAAVVTEGSLSGAARSIGLSQPTLGRHIEALEQTLGARLFDRTLQGLKPTETALKLFEPVATAQRALAEASLIAEGTQEALEGTVRVTASTVVSHYVLPDLLTPIRVRYPGIQIELVPTDSSENLLLRESDIAIRMFRPTQLELVTKKLGEFPLTACAHESYLARRGTPQQMMDLAGHDLIGLDRSEMILEGARLNGVELSRQSFALRTDSQTLIWELVKAGLGVGFAQTGLVNRTPGMRVIVPDLKIPPLEVWLTTHRELFTSRRIRAIYDLLAKGLSTYIGEVASRPLEPSA